MPSRPRKHRLDSSAWQPFSGSIPKGGWSAWRLSPSWTGAPTVPWPRLPSSRPCLRWLPCPVACPGWRSAARSSVSLRVPRARRVLNGAMAALLAASTVLLVNPPLTTRQDPSPPARDRATPPLPGVATLADYQFWTRLRHAGGAPEADAGGSRAAAAPHAVTICSLAGRLWAVPRGRRWAVLPTACGPAQPRSLTRKRDIRTDTQATGRRAEGAVSHTVTLLSQNVLRPCYPPNLPDRGRRSTGCAGTDTRRSGFATGAVRLSGQPGGRSWASAVSHLGKGRPVVPDVNVPYTKMQSAARQLQAGQQTTEGDLTKLKQLVDNLVTSGPPMPRSTRSTAPPPARARRPSGGRPGAYALRLAISSAHGSSSSRPRGRRTPASLSFSGAVRVLAHVVAGLAARAVEPINRQLSSILGHPNAAGNQLPALLAPQVRPQAPAPAVLSEPAREERGSTE
jgi:hypothetical protein